MAGDCNDTDANQHPGQVWYPDADGDGYSEDGGSGITQCTQPSGYASDDDLTGIDTDCNDTNNNINPGITEICNGIDDDCDAQIDEGLSGTFVGDVFF